MAVHLRLLLGNFGLIFIHCYVGAEMHDQIVLFCLSCYGFWFFVIESTILSVPRDWLVSRSDFISSMFQCAFCSGFWVSLPVGVLWWSDEPTINPLFVLCYAFSGAIFIFVAEWYQKANSSD